MLYTGNEYGGVVLIQENNKVAAAADQPANTKSAIGGCTFAGLENIERILGRDIILYSANQSFTFFKDWVKGEDKTSIQITHDSVSRPIQRIHRERKFPNEKPFVLGLHFSKRRLYCFGVVLRPNSFDQMDADESFPLYRDMKNTGVDAQTIITRNIIRRDLQLSNRSYDVPVMYDYNEQNVLDILDINDGSGTFHYEDIEFKTDRDILVYKERSDIYELIYHTVLYSGEEPIKIVVRGDKFGLLVTLPVIQSTMSSRAGTASPQRHLTQPVEYPPASSQLPETPPTAIPPERPSASDETTPIRTSLGQLIPSATSSTTSSVPLPPSDETTPNRTPLSGDSSEAPSAQSPTPKETPPPVETPPPRTPSGTPPTTSTTDNIRNFVSTNTHINGTGEFEDDAIFTSIVSVIVCLFALFMVFVYLGLLYTVGVFLLIIFLVKVMYDKGDDILGVLGIDNVLIIVAVCVVIISFVMVSQGYTYETAVFLVSLLIVTFTLENKYRQLLTRFIK